MLNSSPQSAVSYARVSSKDQEREGYSIPAQNQLLRSYAMNRDVTVLREFVDAETAKVAGRTGFGEMLAFLRKNKACRILLVEKIDRLLRNLKDWVTVDELDLEIHLVKENIIISRDSRSSEKFIYGIKVLMAKNFIDNLSEETKKGMLEKARQGIWPSCAPLGYLNVMGEDGKRTIVPNLDLAPIIRSMYERYATGQHSLREIAKLARQDGMQYPKSKLPVPTSTIHKILRNRIYCGDFDFDGKTYAGKYEPIVSRDLWAKVQDVANGRNRTKPGPVRRDFAFSNLIKCGHCGCAMVGELKKQRYIYYHCTGYRGKCPEPYTREEILEERFGQLLKGLRFPNEILEWIVTALRESHVDEKAFHDEAIARLQAEYRRLQSRIDAMYLDKLDGRIDVAFFDSKSAEWRAEQDRLLRDVETHQNANQTYVEEGVQLLHLAQRAHELFERQVAAEKRRLLSFLLSNCVWKGGVLTAEYRQPFDMLALAREAGSGDEVMSGAKNGQFENWLPAMDSNYD